MNCSIKGTLTSNVLQASSRQVEPGYFDTDRFIDQFGEWRPSKLPEGEIAANAASPRFNEDGSPRLDLNKYGVPFYTDKYGVRTPVIGEAFSSLPLEIRSEVSEEIMNAVVADLLLDHLIDNEDFLAGEKVDDFNLEEYYEERVNEYWQLGMTDQALISTKESKQDYLDGIQAKLRNLGVKVETDAIKQAQSIERPTTDKASPTIKAIMQFVPRLDQAGVPIDSVNIPNNATYMKPSEVWGVVLGHMADIPMVEGKNMVDVYMAKLSELTVTHPWVQEIYDTIDEGSDSLKIQFVTALNNVKNNVNVTTYKNGKFDTINAVSSSTGRNKVASEWVTILKNTSEPMSQEGRDKIGFELMADIQEKLETLPKVKDEEEIGESLMNIHEIISPMFEAMNIGIDENITVGAYNVHLNEINRGKAGDLDYLDGYESFLRTIKDAWLPVWGQAMVNPNEENLANFAAGMARFSEATVNVEDDSGVHMVTVGKNRIYVYSLPSVLQEQINEWKADPTKVQELLNEPSVKNSRLLQHLANPNNLSQLKVGMRGVITRTSETGRVEAKDGKDISKGDYAKVDFNNVMRMLGSNDKNVPIYNTQVPADKGKEFQLEVAGFFTETDSIESASALFTGYVVDEFNTMRQAEHFISAAIDRAVLNLPEGYILESFQNKKPGESSAEVLSRVVQYYPARNEADQELIFSIIEEVKNSMIVNYHLNSRGDLIDTRLDSDTFGMYLGTAFKYTTAVSLNQVDGLKNPITGLPLPKDEIVLSEDPQIKEDIRKVLENAIKNKVDAWKDVARSKFGIFVDPDGSVNGIDSQVFAHYYKKYEGQFTEKVDVYTAAENAMMRDFVTNYMISKVEYAKLFTGDLSYYKSISDYIKRVPATYIDGLQPVTGIEEGDGTFTQMTFATEELRDVALSYDTNLDDNARSHYSKVDRTDAQGYITPKRWRQILLSIGKLSPSAQKVYDKIVKQGELTVAGLPLTEDVLLSPKEIKILSAQPLKGVFFKNRIGESPIYLKYSQAVLLPQFVNNNPKARQLLSYMEGHGIDEMVAQTGVKVGALRPQPLFNSDGEFIATTDPQLQTLDARNWRLQQDLPTKMIKDNKIGVQVQKIIMSGLAFAGDQQLLQDIENALGELSEIGMKDFYNRYGITPGSNGSARISDVQKFYQALIKDVQAKEVPEDNVLRALKAEVPISLLPMLKQSLQNQIFATLRKAATNLMTPGGAYIQISDQLIGGTEIEKRGIKMFKPISRLQAPNVRTWTDASGTVRKTVVPGQVLIPHSMIYKLLPNYQDMTTEELNEAINGELREIIGYRIPTQAKASVDILEIVGILPPELGDSIITYGEITAKTGSDFDIDKMFFMAPEMIKLNEKIVRATKGVKGARNRVLNLFKKVLKDPKYYNEMMTSIDNDTFKEGTLSLLDKRDEEDMDAWDPIRAIDTRFSYRTGGSGVAVSANSLSDHVLTQNKEVSIQFNQGTWGNTHLDKQFSEKLTNQELEELLKVINAKRDENRRTPMSKAEAEARLRKVSISGSLSELTNAFVDIANEDAFVTRGNWGDLTNGLGMMMIRQGIHPHKVSAILRQPAMVDLIEAITNREGVVDNTASWKIEQEVINEWIERAEAIGVNTDFMKIPKAGALSSLAFEELFSSARSQEASTKRAMLNQLTVLKLYKESKGVVKKYNNFVTTIKNDAKGAGRNVADMFLRVNKFSDSYYYEKAPKGQVSYGIENVSQKFFDGQGNNTLSYTMHKNTVGVAMKILNDNPLMFDSINAETFDLFNKAAAENTNDTRVATLGQTEFLFQEFASYKMANFGPISKEDTMEEQKAFIKEIMELKSQRKYTLLNKLLIDVVEGEIEVSMERLSQKSPESKNELSNSWRLILKDNPALGDFLVRQAYRQSNFQPGPKQFHELIPFEWFISKDYLNFLHSDQSIPDNQFLDQAVRRDNATEFFKVLKASPAGEYYIMNLNDEDLRMGRVRKGKGHYRAPRYGIINGGPARLVGTAYVLIPNKNTNKVDRKELAIYIPLNKVTKGQSSYEGSRTEFLDKVDPERVEDGKEARLKETLGKAFREASPDATVNIKDIGDLSIKVEGESFFRDAGDMVDLEIAKLAHESKETDEAESKEMCG